MAKVRIPTGCTFEEVAHELAAVGITLDGHCLPDGRYRAYVRKENMSTFVQLWREGNPKDDNPKDGNGTRL